MSEKVMAEKISRTESIWQILSVWLWITIIVWAELLCLIVFGYLVVNGGYIGRIFIVLYCTHWYNDRFAHENGQRGQGYEFVRKSAWLGHFSKFFSAKCVKTADLPADRNYLFAVFPHGMISIGAISNFATSHTEFRKLYPGIRSRVCTLNYHFLCPFYRELVLSWGLISSKAESITKLLKQSNNKSAVCNYDGYTSNAVVLIVGGAQEALYSRPDNYRVILKKRKGFVKIAIKTGAPLVPVITFGEVDLFDQSNNEPGTKIRAYQDFVKKWTGVAPAFFYGRGFSENSFGFLPYRRPLTTVIGAPIEVVKNENPTSEEIDKVHAEFSDALAKLFEDHKKNYIANWEKVNLTFE